MSVDARLPKRRKKIASSVGIESKHIVSPGDVITEDTGYMRLVHCYQSGRSRSIISVVDKNRSLSIEFDTNQSTNIGCR